MQEFRPTTKAKIPRTSSDSCDSGAPALATSSYTSTLTMKAAGRAPRTHLATDNELVRNILLALLASLAKVESQKIGERTRAGIARARAQGKRIGRPALDPAVQRKIIKQLGEGLSAYAVAKKLGIDAHTVAKYSPFDASAAAG